MTVRDARADDAEAIAEIYNHYIRDTVITFETIELTADDFRGRMKKLEDLGLPWLVVTDDADAVVGYAYAGPFRERAAYVHSLETSVYLHHGATGKGYGKAVYRALIERLRSLDGSASPVAPVHALIAGIALPNDASVALNESLGMRKVAHFEQVGFKMGTWVDVGYWQMTL